MTVLDEVRSERERQDEQWGGADHDDGHPFSTWAWIIKKHEGKLVDALSRLDHAEPNDPTSQDLESARHRAIVVAALMVALVESNDRIYKTPEKQTERPASS